MAKLLKIIFGISLCAFILIPLSASAKDEKKETAPPKAPFMESIETIARGANFQSRDESAVSVTLAPLHFIFRVAF